ncbi:MAG: transcription antitermination factor NusB [Bacteroidaceae bacterium]|nr:transcription antitermination factor NusB [Bacteroidaceae bacterium]
MINRELIRIKVVQLVYAYYGNEGKTMEAAEKEFMFSLDKAYELYHTLLLLIVSLTHMATRIVEMQQSRARRLNEPGVVSTKFVENRFVAQLRMNEELAAFQESQSVIWGDEEDFLRRIYTRITEQDFYQAYIASGKSSYEEDRELWRQIYRKLLTNNEELDDILEERSLYWNDDKSIVDTFVLKTIRRFDASNGAQQKLLPEFKDDDDIEFARTLFRTAIDSEGYFRQLVEEQTEHWDLERIAQMDLIIMQVALAEITSFPEIPLSVSINEYVELAKMYSTPRSSGFINGMLDTMAKRLLNEGRLVKKAL